MVKTGHEIQTDIYALLMRSELVESLGGTIYREGMRPKDSHEEDMIVMFTSADAEQIQSGIVTLNIYVPDIPLSDGVFAEDIARTEEVEKMAQREVVKLTASRSDYLFKLRSAIHTQREPNTNESFVVVKLGFKFFDNN